MRPIAFAFSLPLSLSLSFSSPIAPYLFALCTTIKARNAGGFKTEDGAVVGVEVGVAVCIPSRQLVSSLCN